MKAEARRLADASALRPSLVAGGIIVLAVVAAYHNSFQGPFFFDDRVSITDNPSIQHLWPIGPVLHPPPEAHGVVGRPLFNLSLAINYAISGTGVGSYHAVNLVIHILAALTLFGVMRRTLAGHGGVAFAVALIWALHPLQTEAVTYVSQRAESLMGMFYLLTLYCFIRKVDAASGRVPPREAARCRFYVQGGDVWAWLSVLACFLGMATKEVMVTAPVIVLLYDRTFLSGSFRAAVRRHGRVYLGLVATWLFLGYQMSEFSAAARPSIGLGVAGSWWLYPLTECRVIVKYLGLALWPNPLVFDYGIWAARGGWDLAPDVAIVVLLAAATAYALFSRRFPSLRPLGFAGAWFFIILSPTSSVVAVSSQPMAEHRMYLPLAGVVALAVVGGYALLGRWLRPSIRPAAGGGILAVVALACGGLTVARNEDYRSELAMWKETIARCPTSDRAHGNLGLVLADQERWPEAIAEYQEALRLAPDLVEVRYNLGYALFRSGRLPEAAAAYAQVVRQKPDYADAYNNLGNVLAEEGQWLDAIAAYQQVLRLRPDTIQAHYNLGMVFAQLGRTAEAVNEFEAALRLNPGDPGIQASLAQVLRQQNPSP